MEYSTEIIAIIVGAFVIVASIALKDAISLTILSFTKNWKSNTGRSWITVGTTIILAFVALCVGYILTKRKQNANKINNKSNLGR